jgi:hypothetical protein
MKSPAPHDIVVRVPRYGTVPPSKEVLETAKRLAEASGTIFKPNDTIDPHSAEGESAVSTDRMSHPKL